MIPRHYTPVYKWIAFIGTALQVFISFYLIYGNKNDVVFTEKYEWIRISSGFWGDIHINYHLELDAFNLPLVVLSAFIVLISVVSSFEIQHERKGFYALLMLLSATIMGTFLSLDFFLFFLFFEFMLLPM
ncbi:MAG: NADH-quinone oxidoreductase subunit M, partial [Flammeovirgaceae bacterium]|nr:NADH-quinone oxidoreductase subunit M [Flammeovirgaceae bacterium]MDW8288791.1 NADH-quinone oxidoreductase subunit M [Flammeovirgaceae bacterium]